MATAGGNLCQRPRCWYFRNGFGLLAMKDGKSLVTDGDNRYHAILGNSGPAKFVTPSTIAPALIALNAKVRMVGPLGHREIDLAGFFRAPQSENEREHDLKTNEIVTEIIVPPANGAKSAQYEVRQKQAFDWPLSLASVALWMDGNTVKRANIVLGAVAPVPWHSEEAAHALVGKSINEQTADAAGQAAVSIAKPLSRNAYKVQLTRVAVKRAILEAAQGGQS
jgi:xanthine dehydrogenase YagS FAD-binding subunit